MFESCQRVRGEGHKCSDVTEKLVHLFGWRQTYKVEKLQRSLTIHGKQLKSPKEVQNRPVSVLSDISKSDVKKSLSFDDSCLKETVPDRYPQQFQRNKFQKSYLSLNSSGRSADSWVAVQSLQTSDGGILDPDDRLNDVADDREQIVASFSDGDGPHHGGGDGASGSSVGTGSPDIFQGDGKYYPPPPDIEVTSEHLIANALQVRRGSEPALNQIEGPNGVPGSAPGPPVNNQANKRWSAAPIILDVDEATDNKKKERSKQNGYAEPDWTCHEEEDKTLHPPSKFQRDGSNRLSMQFISDDAGLKWVERANHVRGGSSRSSQSSSLHRDHRRREPLGQANSSNSMPTKNSEYVIEEGNMENVNTEYIVLRNEGGPLGIHVVPDYDNEGRDRGLLVQGIEPGGRVHRDGRLNIFDRIIEINGSNLINEPFLKVQEIFKNSLSSGELRLRVVKHNQTPSLPGNRQHQPPAPVYPVEPSSSSSNMVEGRERVVNSSAKVATVSPTKKLPVGAAAANILQTANTRKMGKRIDLELLKGPSGLGFSITTRDNPAGGNCPIYIKNILPKGAAVDDGRLRPGDRLLQVNDIEMTGKTQPEAVAILRQCPTGSIVKISVSRQEDVYSKDELSEEKESHSPRQERNIDENHVNHALDMSVESGKPLPEEVKRPAQPEPVPHKIPKPPRALDESQIFPWRHREILTFDIPVHDTEKAGLGVSVKGKTSANHSNGSLNNSNSTVDLGIFVKSVIHGGAASRDGRLRTNDQLLNVNGKSLLNQSNANAMETLRRAMLYMEGPKPGVISLTIARRVSSPGSRGSSSSLHNSSGLELCRADSDGVTPEHSIGSHSIGSHSIGSEASDSTVIFLPGHDSSYKSDRLNDSQISSSSQRSQDYSVSRNPVIDRLTGHHPGLVNNALRNESYYRATHETTWNTSNMVNTVRSGKLSSPTVNPVVAEPVLIEEDYQISSNHSNQREPLRRPSQEMHKNLVNQRCEGSVSGSGQSISTHGDVTYASQLSLDEAAAAGFSRDAFGRQSMSEKRHATLDAKNTDTYRRNKKMREERQQNTSGDQTRQNQIIKKIAEIRQELLERNDNRENRGRSDVGPSLGMKKSSSLESLQTMVQEIQMAEDPDPAYTYRNSQGTVRVIRGRGCNESFRAAVDRSYDAPLGLRNQMETLSEEEGLHGNSEPEENNILGRGTPRQSSMNAARDPKLKHSKKKAGLLKGIGSMFRFGKHRKTMESGLHGNMEEEEENEEIRREENEERQREEARIAAQEEHEKIQEQYRRLLLRQQQECQFQAQPLDNVNTNNVHQEPKYSNRDDNRNNLGYWRQNEVSGGHRDVKENNNRNSHVPQYQRIYEGELNRSNEPRLIELEARQRNRSYDMGRDREADRQRKFSLDSRNLIEENKEEFYEGSPQSRSERIQQLRAKHQKRHVERRGQYPLEEREEKYEQAIRQRLDDPKTHIRSVSYDLYGEMGRPGSRVGISDPTRFSHYVNYEKIQQHLNRGKQHYHSQRRDNRETHQRPVSNFYEYESVQSVMRSPQQQNSHPNHRKISSTSSKQSWQETDSLPRRIDSEQNKINASSLPRRIEPQEFHNSPSVKKTVNYLNQLSSGNPPSAFQVNRIKREDPRCDINNVRTRGPFISQITIKENPNES